MKLSYKQKLFLYFVVIFALFTTGIIIFERSRERVFRTETLEAKLEAYADVVHNSLSLNDSVPGLLPSNVRLTVVDKRGVAVYDNVIGELSTLGNHLQRPEMIAARANGTGSNIRTSATNSNEYLYFAKRFDNYYIRVALPYDVHVQHFLKSDNLFLYYIVVLFVGMLLLMNVIAGRFGKSIKQLRDFIEKPDTTGVEFPDDELGDIGGKIIENYNHLKTNKKRIFQEREKLLQHVHSSEEGICFYSASQEVEFYNGLFIHYLNNIVDSAGSDPAAVFSDAAFAKLNEFLESGPDENYFEMRIDRQGKSFSARVNIFEDKGFELIINDITRQEKTRLLKQEMTGNIAHELRTPVTSIRGYLETVLEQPLDQQKQRYFLTQAFNQTIVLSELIRDMGLITKMEEAPQSFSLEPVNIGSLLEDLRCDLAIPLKDRGIKMEWNVGGDVVVNGNRNLLYSVFRNLTDNVIRYAGCDVSVWISKYNEDADFYYFSYSDTGAGISDDQHLNRLFERFYRINEGRTRDTGGSGLGLSIVKNAVLFHHGTITVKNRPGGGLEFLFKIQK